MSTAPVWQGSDAELLAELGALKTRLHSTWAQMLSVVAEIDSRGMADGLRYGSTVQLVRAVARVSRGGLSPLAAPRPTTEGEVDLRTAAHRDADALVELAQRALGSGELPTEGGERPQVVVTVSLPVLQGRIGSASLALGGPINATIARRIACDARVIPVVLGSRGEPLDVGRASQTVPTAIRRAVIVRDRGCAFPGCSVPARWREIHHVMYWADGGPTSLGNCVALRAAPPTHSPFRLVDRHGQRYPRIPSTTLVGRASTPQSPPHRPRADPNPPVDADSCAHHASWSSS